MSSGPPSKPLMSQNPSLRGPLLACSRRATDDCNRRRPPSAHAHAPTECSSVPRSSHLCHAPTPPQIPPVTTPSSPSSTAPSTQVPSRSNPCQSVSNPRPALGPWSIRAKVPRRTGPPVNASKSVKIRQISDPLGPLLSPPLSAFDIAVRRTCALTGDGGTGGRELKQESFRGKSGKYRSFVRGIVGAGVRAGSEI